MRKVTPDQIVADGKFAFHVDDDLCADGWVYFGGHFRRLSLAVDDFVIGAHPQGGAWYQMED